MARILLADDDTATLDFYSRSLTGAGFDVVTAQDGQEAMEKLSGGGSFDMLITDIEMPGIDGITLAERAIAATPAIKVLLVSGFEGGMARAAKLTGPNVVALNKPLSLEQIVTEVKKHLG